jgi:hypothetical protein
MRPIPTLDYTPEEYAAARLAILEDWPYDAMGELPAAVVEAEARRRRSEQS